MVSDTSLTDLDLQVLITWGRKVVQESTPAVIPTISGFINVGCGMWDVGCGMWDVGCAMFNVQCSMCNLGCGLSAIYILHFTFYNLHFTIIFVPQALTGWYHTIVRLQKTQSSLSIGWFLQG